MKKTTTQKPTIEEVVLSLDEMFLDLATLNDKIDTLYKHSKTKEKEIQELFDEVQRDVIYIKTKVEELHRVASERDVLNLQITKHVERLTREKEVLLMHLGLNNLKQKTAPKPVDSDFVERVYPTPKPEQKEISLEDMTVGDFLKRLIRT